MVSSNSNANQTNSQSHHNTQTNSNNVTGTTINTNKNNTVTDSRYLYPRVGIGGFITCNDKPGYILLGERIGSHGSNTWALPGGHLEYNETIAQCIEREIYEECNIHVTFNKVIGVSENVFNDVHKHYITLFTLCTMNNTNDTIVNSEPHKCKGWHWIKYSDLVNNIHTQQYMLFAPLQSFVEQNQQLDISNC